MRNLNNKIVIPLDREFYELLQVAIGRRKSLARSLSADEWEDLYSACETQLVLGFSFSGIQKLPEEQMPPAELLAKWQKVALIENERWKRGSEICRRACETHERNGFYSCVLMTRLAQVGDKSLGFRDESLGFRGGDPKDIDILCWSKDKKDGKRTIVEYVNFQYVASTKHIKPKVVRHHVNFASGNIPLEVHFKSDYLNCPWYNKRYEAWVREMVERSSKSDSCELPVEFYVVYQLLHLYKKLFCEGIRFGHLVEYYYTLREFKDEGLEVSRPPQSPCVGGEIKDGRLEVRDERLEVMRVIANLGMRKFAGAVMYVLQTVFGMPDECLICKADARHGSFVLNMVTLAGEYTRHIERTRTLSHLGRLGHYLYWIKRNRPFITQYPAELFFELYKRIRG